MSASRDLGLGAAGLCRCVHGTLLVSSRAEAALCPQASTASGGPPVIGSAGTAASSAPRPRGSDLCGAGTGA